MKLIDDWCEAHKLWSVRLMAAGSFVYSMFLAFPEHALSLWGFVPPEARAILPPRVIATVPLLLFLGAMWARLVKQRKLENKDA